MILREWETAKAEPANDFLYNILPEKVCIILSWLELWYCNPFFIGGIMVDVNFLHTNWQTKLIKYQTTYTMYAEQCTLSEWIIYLREQFEVCFEQNIEKHNKVCVISFQMTMVHKTRENMFRKWVLSIIMYQCNALLPSLSKASKSAPYFEIMLYKNDVWPYWAATWTAWHNNQHGEQSNRRFHLTHR